MKSSESHEAIVNRLDPPSREKLKEAIATGEIPKKKLGGIGKFGIWVWVVLLGADVAYELFAFHDGREGAPTISQIIKRARRAGGIAGSIILVILLAVGYIVLNLHLVADLF